jgi:hypothetical protein
VQYSWVVGSVRFESSIRFDSIRFDSVRVFDSIRFSSTIWMAVPGTGCCCYCCCLGVAVICDSKCVPMAINRCSKTRPKPSHPVPSCACRLFAYDITIPATVRHTYSTYIICRYSTVRHVIMSLSFDIRLPFCGACITVAELQSCRVAELQSCRVAELQL